MNDRHKELERRLSLVQQLAVPARAPAGAAGVSSGGRVPECSAYGTCIKGWLRRFKAISKMLTLFSRVVDLGFARAMLIWDFVSGIKQSKNLL